MTEQQQPPTDQDIRQCLERREFREAFERLVPLYSEKVFHLALSMLRNPTQAEDMTQETLFRVWKGLPGYNGSASLSTWIYTIARNTCLTELKKRAARPTVSLDEPDLEGARDAIPALQSTDRETGVEMDVHQMLEQLPEKYRQVISLYYLEQKSYEEVSRLLNLPLGTVKTFLYRAKKELIKISRRFIPAAAMMEAI